MTPLHVRVHGREDGQAILFLHGVGNTGGMWDRHAAALPEYRCIAPDLPGHGRSRGVRWASRAVTADLVAGLAEELVPGRPVHVVGLSLGGSVAFELLARRPDLVARAVVDGCAAVRSPFEPVMQVGVGLVAPLVRRRAVARMIARSVGLTDPAEIEDLASQLAQVDPGSFRRAFSDAQEVRPTPALIGCGVPSLLVAGEREMATVRGSNRMLADRMPGCEARMMPGAPHGWLGGHHTVHVAMVRAWVEGSALPDDLVEEALTLGARGRGR